jgi:hypothetical protein
MSTLESVYRELAKILSERKNDEVLEIEILPPGLGPLLHDGSSIGITKKALVQAFVIARRIFLEKLVCMDENIIAAARGKYDNHDDLVSVAEQGDDGYSIPTEIILLFDCEHLTACNWRKRRLHALIQPSNVFSDESTRTCSSNDPDDDNRPLMLLERERSLMTTYLCSPLHRHTKSPTLWQHRLWVMTQIVKSRSRHPRRDSASDQQPQQQKMDAAVIIPVEDVQSLLLAELAVVLRAGEQHPKNYYAFSYMRQLHSAASRLFAFGDAAALVRQGNTDSGELCLSSQLAQCMVDPTLTWCLAHPRDISGWTFLFFLLDTGIVPTDCYEKDQGREPLISKGKNVIDKVIHFAVNIAAWEGESLWTFVSLMVRRFGPTILPSFFSGHCDDDDGDGEMNGLNDSLLSNNCAVEKVQTSGGRLVNDTILLPDLHWKKLMKKARVLRAGGVHSAHA